MFVQHPRLWNLWNTLMYRNPRPREQLSTALLGIITSKFFNSEVLELRRHERREDRHDISRQTFMSIGSDLCSLSTEPGESLLAIFPLLIQIIKNIYLKKCLAILSGESKAIRLSIFEII